MLKAIAYIFGSLVILFIFFLYIIGSIAPETYVYLGRHVPKKYVREINKLELLDEDEKIKYFYTDGFLDIKDGLYFVTDKKLVLYSSEWEEPKTIIEFQEISSLEVDYDDSFLDDSFITLETKDGLLMSFPVSSEKQRDKAFYEYLLQKSELNQNDRQLYDPKKSKEAENSVDTIVQ